MDDTFEDARASDPVERLLEDSWDSRSDKATRRELTVEAVATLTFLVVAVPLAAPALAGGRVRLGVAMLLVALYAVVSRMIRFPLGAGHVVPSYLVLVPMLLLLPAASVPLLAAIGLVLGTGALWIAHRARAEQLLFAVPDAWHALGPALILLLAGSVDGTTRAAVYVAAFVAGCLVDLVISTVREAGALGVAPRIQLRVMAGVWWVDACIAPLGLLFAYAARQNPALLLLMLPLFGLLALADRDRKSRIEEAQRRLAVVAHQRTRLQSAVSRLGDAFAAKLDLQALSDVVLHGSIDALDACAGRLIMQPPGTSPIVKSSGPSELARLLEGAGAAVRSRGSRIRSRATDDARWRCHSRPVRITAEFLRLPDAVVRSARTSGS